MSTLVRAGWVVRATGLVMLVLGLLIWTGIADAIVPIHMLIGLVLAVALWTTAYLALRAGAKPALPAVAIAWGLFMVLYGATQKNILPADGHTAVQVVHLLVGIVAIGLGEALVATGGRGAARVA
jgi:hypothetical protein